MDQTSEAYRWNLLVPLKVRACFTLICFLFQFLLERLTVPLQTRPQQHDGDDVKAPPPSSSWSPAVGVGVPAGTKGAELQSHLPRNQRNVSQNPQRSRRLPSAPRWLGAVVLRSPSSITTTSVQLFLFYFEAGACFWLQERFALQGVFPLKNSNLKRSVEKRSH